MNGVTAKVDEIAQAGKAGEAAYADSCEAKYIEKDNWDLAGKGKTKEEKDAPEKEHDGENRTQSQQREADACCQSQQRGAKHPFHMVRSFSCWMAVARHKSSSRA